MAVTKPTKKREVKKEKTEVNTNASVLFYVTQDEYKHFEDADILKLRRTFQVNIEFDGDKFIVSSQNIKNCRKTVIVLEKIFYLISKGIEVLEEDVNEFISSVTPQPLHTSNYKAFYTTSEGLAISPRTENQELLVHTITHNTITVVHGVAGSGKTKITCALALKYLQNNMYDKILVFRPVSFVGRELGFYPGTADEKYMNFCGPIVDTFIDLLGEKTFEFFVKSKKIIFSPIAQSRGSNWENSYILIDEIQNISKVETLTLLTRFNTNTKLVLTGDVSQSDIKGKGMSGLDYCLERLKDIDDIGIVKMNKSDIQRHKLVSEIIDAFED